MKSTNETLDNTIEKLGNGLEYALILQLIGVYMCLSLFMCFFMFYLPLSCGRFV